MPEDIMVAGDVPLRTYKAKIDEIHITKWNNIYGCRFSPEEAGAWRYARNLPNGILFIDHPKMIKKLNYKTKFHDFIAKHNPYAWYSYYYSWTARLTAFMFLDEKDMLACKTYFEKEYFPRFILKHNVRLIEEAKAIRDKAQSRVDQLESEMLGAKSILSVKKTQYEK